MFCYERGLRGKWAVAIAVTLATAPAFAILTATRFAILTALH